MNPNIFSHPNKPLKDHLFNVYDLGMSKFDNTKFNFKFDDKLRILTELVLIAHDFGKANDYFQRKLQLSIKEDLTNEEELEYQLLSKKGVNESNHSLLSAVLAYVISETLIDDDVSAFFAFMIIRKHHGNLLDFNDFFTISEKEWDILNKQFQKTDWNYLQNILTELAMNDSSELGNDIVQGTPLIFDFETIKRRLSGPKFRRKQTKALYLFKNSGFEYYLAINYIFSLLISSDKAEAIFYGNSRSYEELKEVKLNRKHVDKDIVDKYRFEKTWINPKTGIDQKRNEIYDELMENMETVNPKEERIFSINVPTGTGKTLAALSAGLKLRDIVGEDRRIIYALPFTSIIDQNYDIFRDVFQFPTDFVDTSVLLKHHHLTPEEYSVKNAENEEIVENYDISKNLIESWDSEVIVTTFVQLLHSILSNRNKNLLKFNNIANSIILLDEVQNIPYKYWELIKIILKELSEVLDCYIVLITATMPLIYDEEKNEIKELIPNKKDYFEYFDRIVLDVSNLEKEMTLLEFKSFIEFELLKYPEKNFLIVLNTIKTSIDIYQYIESLIEKDIIFGNPMYLSSNIIPKERKDRIKNIKTKGEKRKIIVSTQVIEAGVDIDLDRVYRDIAPLDSINQTCGRCNRNFSSEKGVVTIFKLVQDNSKNNTYAGYVYSNALIQKTERILLDNSEKGVIDEKNFYELNKKYFNVLNDYKSNDTSNEILEKIKTLMYEKAFFGSNERNGEEPFKLIDEIDSVNLFIELDEVAISLWATYETIFSKKMNNFSDAKKRKEEYSKIKSNFLNYVITIPRKVAEKQLPGENLDNLFNRVPKELIKTAYLKDTGFIRNETNQNYFF